MHVKPNIFRIKLNTQLKIRSQQIETEENIEKYTLLSPPKENIVSS